MEPTVEKLVLAELVVDSSYQRDLKPRRVKKIVKNFNPALAGILDVSKRPDNTYRIVDGQHRVAAMKELGIREWPAKITRMEAAEEATTFVDLQTQRNPINTLDRHKALLVAENEQAVAVQEVVDTFGLRIISAQTSTAPKGIKAVAALNTIYDGGGKEHLFEVMSILSRAWPEELSLQVFQSRLLLGLSKLIRAYPDIDRKELVLKLSGVSPQKLTRDSAAMTEYGDGDRTTTMAKAMLRRFNAGKSARRIDESQLAKRAKALPTAPSK